MTVDRSIRQTVDLIGRANGLDKHAVDWINTALCGAIDREMAVHEARRVAWKIAHGAQPEPQPPADPQLTLDGMIG
jgi:hypothetical protein